MKVLLVTRLDGWWEGYAEQIVNAFSGCGVTCQTLDYQLAKRGRLQRLWTRPNDDTVLRRKRADLVIRAARAFQPDMILTHCRRLDFSRVREGTKRRLVFWDIEGPTGGIAQGDVPGDGSVDMLLSASSRIVRLHADLGIPIYYVPHAVDVDLHAPRTVAESQRRRFESPLNFVGTPDARRAEYLELLADHCLTIWGHRWSKAKWRNETLKPCIRERRDVVGEDLIDLYRSTTVFINVLSERHSREPSLLNLQAFAVPASGTCLLTEWTEELDAAFEVGSEVLAFRALDELVELATRYGRDADGANRIGARGRQRCEAEHSFSHRVARILELTAGMDAVR
jgi:hypothetical protein